MKKLGKLRALSNVIFALKEFETAGILYMNKCQGSRLKDAGDCFSLAQRWKTAAEVYSDANCYSESLSACAKGNLFDMGLQLLDSWKERWDNYVDTAKGQELETLKEEFVEKGASYYSEMKDTDNMIKFVRLFKTVDLRYLFLRSRDHLVELMHLEAECRNFHVAAYAALLTGDLLFEADMLEKDENFRESSRVILHYILFSSLWSKGSGGWPLKNFPDKEKLLVKVKLMAKKEGDDFYDSVCVQCDALSEGRSFLEMIECFLVSRRKGINQAEIISCRKNLDLHIDGALPDYKWDDGEIVRSLKQDCPISREISIEALLYYWRFSTVDIQIILDSLDVTKTESQKACWNFCMAYLGANPVIDETRRLRLVIPNFWQRKFLSKQQDLIMEEKEFVTAARRYWVPEVMNQSLKVLWKLESLYEFSTKKQLSMVSQVKCLFCIFEVVCWISKFQRREKLPATLQTKGVSWMKRLLSMMFHIDWEVMMMEEMMSLRSSEIFKELLQGVIGLTLESTDKRTPTQVRLVVMSIFIAGSLSGALYWQIVSDWAPGQEWETFIKDLKENMDSPKFLVDCFWVNLKVVFDCKWMTEYAIITPGCLVYLLERLLLLVSFSQGFVFTTKAYLAESRPTAELKFDSGTLPLSNFKKFLEEFYEVVVTRIISQFLLKKASQS